MSRTSQAPGGLSPDEPLALLAGIVNVPDAAYTYRMILGWSELDQRCLAEVPELPGCMADGFTPEEALANAEVIIGEWIEVAQLEGRPVPKPLEPSATSV